MKKLIALLLLSPLTFAEDVFLKCESPLYYESHKLHLNTDEEKVLSSETDGKWRKYLKNDWGILTWEANGKAYKIGDREPRKYFLNRIDLILKVESVLYRGDNKPDRSSKHFSCEKLNAQF